MLMPELGRNAEGYCKKCGNDLGISGICYYCAVKDIDLEALSEKSTQIMNQQHSLFMYRLMHIIEVASLTRETNPAMQEIMDIAGGSRDAEMIEKGVV